MAGPEAQRAPEGSEDHNDESVVYQLLKKAKVQGLIVDPKDTNPIVGDAARWTPPENPDVQENRNK